jgi:microcystin-dependent protein
MSEPFLAEIRIFPYSFAPQGWAFCNGQILPISQNTALFSLLGTTYGGDGKSTFALPDLRNRTAIHAGQGPGLSNRSLGEPGGAASVTLVEAEIGTHTHSVAASGAEPDSATATNAVLASPGVSSNLPPIYGTPGTVSGALFGVLGGNGNGAQPHPNQQPYLGLSYCIAIQGIFPARS